MNNPVDASSPLLLRIKRPAVFGIYSGLFGWIAIRHLIGTMHQIAGSVLKPLLLVRTLPVLQRIKRFPLVLLRVLIGVVLPIVKIRANKASRRYPLRGIKHPYRSRLPIESANNILNDYYWLRRYAIKSRL